MSSPFLNSKTLAPKFRTLQGTPERTEIVHLGLGNFHRAHQAVYTAQAVAAHGGDWGILGVANRSTTVVDAMNAQDGLYTVLEISPGATSAMAPGIHTGAIVAAQSPQAVVEAIAAQDTRIVTLTVTEHGYSLSPETGRLALEDPGIAGDLTGRGPHTAVGQLARALELRARTHGAPLTILSCDNMQSNGNRTRGLVFDFLDAVKSPKEIREWARTHVTFPNSMVDRIVPATTSEYSDMARELTGVVDRSPVPAEPFGMWVLEDSFAAGRPAWDTVGAVFSTEVEAYELVKLRLLNGTHSLIAYLGALDGRLTIPESRGQDFIEDAARAVILDEYLPSITLPTGFEPDAYIAQLFDRWSNTVLAHRTQQVGSDGSVKLPQRVPAPALRLLGAGIMPQHLALTVAAWLACVAPLPGFDPGAEANQMHDPARARLALLAGEARDAHAFVEGVFTRGTIFAPELSRYPELITRVGDYVEIITTHGARAAAGEAAQSRASSGATPA